jgi:Fe(3+) dicitrate transport protein
MTPIKTRCATVLATLMLAVPLAAQQRVAPTSPTLADTTVAPAYTLAEIRVVSTPAELSRIPGSATLLAPTVLEQWRTTTTADALRRVPGVAVREEEGLGLRPNIGIRGLNPTRSSKVLLLEDGIPLTFAPYGDNAAYYHPPVTRFDEIEVLRGSGQIAFGPQTVGGVINYITPAIPRATTGRVSLIGGSRGFFDVSGRGSTHLGPVGALATFSHRTADGARENTGTDVTDLMLKASTSLGARHMLTARANYYRERSNVTYSGLTEAEFAENPWLNPFANDSMKLDRWGASATHAFALSPFASVTTTVYTSDVNRDWWRQSSNSAQRPNDASDPNCGGMANLLTSCGNEGRLRSYRVYGAEPRLRLGYELLGAAHALEAGVRWHSETQDRRQLNGATPTAREAGPEGDANAGLREDNLRHNTAWAAFVQQRTTLGQLTLTPGLRVEHVAYERTNRLNEASGSAELTQLIPGIGTTYEVRPGLLLFAGAHRGFAPPRTEDVIDNSTGATVELDAELSWNVEAGFRGHAGPLNVELTAFRMDFENQIIPASVAGGTGAALTNSGRTLHQGAELGLRLDAGQLIGFAGPYLESSATWLPTARFEGERFAYIGTTGSEQHKVFMAQNGAGTRQQLDVNGKRLPYAPEVSFMLGAGFHRDGGLDLRVERYAVGEQFTDAASSRVTVADGQQGTIDGYAIWNVSASQRLARTGTRVFLNVRNLTDELYIADRSRGILPGAPRSVVVGVRQEF